MGSQAVQSCLGGFVGTSLNPEQKRDRFEAALARGAAARSQEYSDSPYEAALYATVQHVMMYVESQAILSRLANKAYLTPQERDLRREMRDKVIHFNDALRELIYCASETDPAKLNFSELVQVLSTTYLTMTNQNAMLASPERSPAHTMLRTTAIGMRNEVAFEDILSQTDLDWRPGADRDGADYWINDAKFDIKASDLAAQKGQAKAVQEGRNPLSIYDPRINFDDFNNQLRLPIPLIHKLAQQREPELAALAAAIRNG